MGSIERDETNMLYDGYAAWSRRVLFRVTASSDNERDTAPRALKTHPAPFQRRFYSAATDGAVSFLTRWCKRKNARHRAGGGIQVGVRPTWRGELSWAASPIVRNIGFRQCDRTSVARSKRLPTGADRSVPISWPHAQCTGPSLSRAVASASQGLASASVPASSRRAD